MPSYEYECPVCGYFTAQAVLAQSSEDRPCHHCGRMASRRLSAVRLSKQSRTLTRAMDRCEASAHEPRVTTTRHGESGLHRHSTSPTHARAHRPWMIGH